MGQAGDLCPGSLVLPRLVTASARKATEEKNQHVQKRVMVFVPRSYSVRPCWPSDLCRCSAVSLETLLPVVHWTGSHNREQPHVITVKTPDAHSHVGIKMAKQNNVSRSYSSFNVALMPYFLLLFRKILEFQKLNISATMNSGNVLSPVLCGYMLRLIFHLNIHHQGKVQEIKHQKSK